MRGRLSARGFFTVERGLITSPTSYFQYYQVLGYLCSYLQYYHVLPLPGLITSVLGTSLTYMVILIQFWETTTQVE